MEKGTGKGERKEKKNIENRERVRGKGERRGRTRTRENVLADYHIPELSLFIKLFLIGGYSGT